MLVSLGVIYASRLVSPLRELSLNFDLIHCDLWTSPVDGVSGYKYYLVILDDCLHFQSYG